MNPSDGSRLHILLVSSPFDRLTGADRDFINLCNSLNPEQFRFTWAGQDGCASIQKHLDPKMVERVIEFDQPVFHQLMQEQQEVARSPWLWAKIVGRMAQRSVIAANQLKHALSGDKPNLVLTNSAALWAGACYARRSRLPHVWAVKEWLDPQRLACRRYARFMRRMSAIVTVPSQPCATVFGPGGALVICSSTDVQDIKARAQGRSRQEVLQGLGWPVARPVVAQVGAYQHWKGQHITVEALALLAAKSDEPTCSTLLLGNGSRAAREGLQAQIGTLPPAWQAAVRLEEFPPDNFSMLNCADVVVHPSVLPDPYPNAVREAMVLGKAVIGSAAGGIPEMIENGYSGLLVAPGDTSALAGAVQKLLDDLDARQRLGAAAAVWANEQLDAEKCGAAWATLLLDTAYQRHFRS